MAIATKPDVHRDLVLVAGEPGVGKTRLCAEFAQRAAGEDVLVLYGHSVEENLVPLQPFMECISHFLAYVDDEEFWTRLRNDPAAKELAPFVPELARATPPGEAAPVEDVDTGRFRLFDSVRHLLDLISVQWPLVLLFDDLQWADKQSLLLLKYIARADERGRMAVIGTYRPTDRNKLVEDHYAKLGFSQLGQDADGTTTWSLDVESASFETARMVVRSIGFTPVAGGHDA